ncbi:MULTISPECIES: TatD family hydrolase [unclassified Dysgonomonas]|uniref:TatD family hydrolase n=1 Tax=unclassified Dysgonomonas TaxID=2630389 RepID=UPI0009E18BB5|nr:MULTISPECIES: TatD family hydrolase [unclassified Dysgonomonas]MBD8346752.1 TatD family hydrolase [Dysgonomonas sp. HGC4]MBF0577251.1 TatD family hydrolase [Dysgonomonas sp. GY617]
MDLYDIHTHDAPSPNSDDDESLRRNISYIVNVYPLGFEYAKDNENYPWFSCGVHPWYSEDAEPQLKFLKEIAGDPRIVAIGEAGLDKLKGPDLKIQQPIFEQQVQLSEQLQKPLIIHCVKAWEELLHIKKLYKPRQPWIIHGYKGKVELAKQLLSHGFLLSINERFNDDAIREIPLDRLFCETDISETSIEDIYSEVAKALNISVEVLALQIAENVKRTFPLLSIS